MGDYIYYPNDGHVGVVVDVSNGVKTVEGNTGYSAKPPASNWTNSWVNTYSPWDYCLYSRRAFPSQTSSGSGAQRILGDDEMAEYYIRNTTGQIGRFAGGVTIFPTLDAYNKHRQIVLMWNSMYPNNQLTVPPDSSNAANFFGLDDYGWSVQVDAHGGIVS